VPATILPDANWLTFARGERVVVRSHLAPGEAKRYQDVIGIVLENDGQMLTLQKDAAGYQRRSLTEPNVAEIVALPWANVAVAKRVPPRPNRRESTAENT